MVHIGVVSSLLGRNIDRFHRVTRLFTRDAEAPARWGRAHVVRVVQAGRERLDGLAMVWGANADAVMAQLVGAPDEPLGAALPDPLVLVVVAQVVPEVHGLRAWLNEVKASGREAVLLEVPAERANWMLRREGATLIGVPGPGVLRTEPPPVVPPAGRGGGFAAHLQSVPNVVPSSLPERADDPVAAAEPTAAPEEEAEGSARTRGHRSRRARVEAAPEVLPELPVEAEPAAS